MNFMAGMLDSLPYPPQLAAPPPAPGRPPAEAAAPSPHRSVGGWLKSPLAAFRAWTEEVRRDRR